MIKAHTLMNVPRDKNMDPNGYYSPTPQERWLGWVSNDQVEIFPLTSGGNMLRLAYVLWPPNAPLLWPEPEDYEDTGP